MHPSAIASVPVLSCADAGALEAALLGGEERAEWAAMQAAGRGVAAAVLRDLAEAGGMPGSGRLLVLAGKGKNAGDALLAACAILEAFPGASADVLFAFGPRRLGPPAARAWRALAESARGRVRSTGASGLSAAYDLCLDGIFGFQFRPPLNGAAYAVIEAARGPRIRLRAAVDLPSGWSEPGAFRADFTYATGSVKAPLLGCANAGRPRFVDLGFFPAGGAERPEWADGDRVLCPAVLAPLAGLRPAGADKRSQGHLAVVGGSADLPGAVLMAVMAALRSGAGLVTAFVPARLSVAFASRAPEAMWVGLPETPGGGLALGALGRIVVGLERAGALLLGPGLGRDPETAALALELVKTSPLPLVIDADALQPGTVREGYAPRILTPHAGEYARLGGGADLRAFAAGVRGVVAHKGPVTRVSGGGAVYHAFFGGPVLSRGGSGDVLAGLAGGLLAQAPGDPLAAACRAVAWHGMAADGLARAHGQAAVHTLQLLDFLPPALREASACPAS